MVSKSLICSYKLSIVNIQKLSVCTVYRYFSVFALLHILFGETTEKVADKQWRNERDIGASRCRAFGIRIIVQAIIRNDVNYA